AIERIKVQAAPPNCVRLEMSTPCSVTGVCADCHSEDCICCATVITRHNRVPGRIHVILVGEELGF
ncbi:MAG: lactate utilization protein, partial [Oscillospiraceae bacterium]|nr:lactate utilization protein [Oscillospiraceae bacterium]